MEAEAIRTECVDRKREQKVLPAHHVEPGAIMTVGLLPRETGAKEVGDVVVSACMRRVVPLRLGGKAICFARHIAQPFRIGDRVVPSDA